MTNRLRLPLLVVLALGLAGAAAAATDATPHEIYEAAQSGHLAEAQQMINQVLQDHPQNAKAHFIAAELDARIGDLAAARQQLATAKQLDPTNSFAQASALNALQRQLTGMTGVTPSTAVPGFTPVVRHSSVSWGLILVLAIGGFVLFSILRSRSRAYGQGSGPGLLPPGNPGLQSGYGYGPGYPPPGGSGLMGNLASGLAIGAGVAAGEELIRHVIDGNNPGNQTAADLRDAPQNQDMGGADFGTQDGSSWGNDSSGGDSGGWGGDSGGGGGDWT
ncbi:MAG TPA: tetratricopeptide repeat protein [Steroidobacteraceae bacterium]|nr:tetratricopeptide repeat protein [Steroidobacteraceae bacterium]